jgi:hypothetical protein
MKKTKGRKSRDAVPLRPLSADRKMLETHYFAQLFEHNYIVLVRPFHILTIEVG